MKPTILAVIMALAVCVSPVICQDAPIYRVTVVERTMKAINYQYRNGPTAIDFRGTVLLPKAKGSAIVESKQGRTEIDAKFENLSTPQGFGLEYMAYVLWAITPEGRPVNLGEIVANSADKGSLHVTTDLKAFGLLVTAEPYGAVHQPSDVVVAENHVREDTIGKIEEIGVKYELMPRGHYTYNVSSTLKAELANAPKVSMHKYEALLELYQAQNALAIAKNARADTYAPNTFSKAQALLNEAEQLNANKNVDSHRVVDSAREAAQTAEDARQIADRRMHEEQLAQARASSVSAEQARLSAEASAQRARADADQARLQADSERAARVQAEADAASARERARQAEYNAQTRVVAPPPPPRIIPDPAAQADHEKSEMRMRLLEQLNGTLATRDTAWGLMVTVPDRLFAGTNLRPLSFDQLRRISAIVASHPGLRVVIEGHSDSPSTEAIASRRAEVVRDQLVASGLPTGIVEVRRMGDTRLLGSNSTEAGREENRRVEVIISGDPIGKFPFWDHPYTLTTTTGANQH